MSFSSKDFVEAQKRLFDLYRHPANWEGDQSLVADVRIASEGCDDRIMLYDRTKDGVFSVTTRQQGCAVCVASTSVMTQMVNGLSVEKAAELAARMPEAIEAEDESLPEEMFFMRLVRGQPNKLDCAALPWKGLRRLFEKMNAWKEKAP